MQDAIAIVFAGMLPDRFLNREQIVVTLATGSNVVLHNLGYQPSGWHIISRDSAATVYDTARSTTSITLQASAAITATLEVW
jgi:hypothetical protein